MYRLNAFACYLQVIILFILIIFPVRRETLLCSYFFGSPKFIFSPDNWITFYIIQNSKTKGERSTQSGFKNVHNTIEFNISKEQRSASLIFGNHDSGLNCGLYLRLTKGHCWEMKVKSK